MSLLVDDQPLPAYDKLRYARLLGLPYAAVLSPDHPDTEIEVIARSTGRTTRTKSQPHRRPDPIYAHINPAR